MYGRSRVEMLKWPQYDIFFLVGGGGELQPVDMLTVSYNGNKIIKDM